jgi:VanZ family protein
MEEDQAPPSSQGKSFLKIWGPPAAMASIILIFSSIPGTAFPQHPNRLNNAVHFLQFGLLGYYLAKAIGARWTMGRFNLILITTAVCSTFGFVDEAHQFLVPYRMFDIFDMFYDTLGALAGGLFFLTAGRMSWKKGGA